MAWLIPFISFHFTSLLFVTIHFLSDHAGVSNAQLIKEEAPIAKLYAHRSVAEQNSVDISWDLLMDPQYEDLRAAIYDSQEELLHLRQLIVNIVLATDIFDSTMKGIREKRWEHAFAEIHDIAQEAPVAEAADKRPAPLHASQRGEASVRENEDDEELQLHLKATVVMEHLIQASDIAHTMQHWDIFLKWNERLFHEMMLAWEAGRGPPKDPSESWYAGEIFFFDKYIIPLAKKLQDTKVFGASSDECLNYANMNRTLWSVHGEEQVEKYKKSYEEYKRKRLKMIRGNDELQKMR